MDITVQKIEAGLSGYSYRRTSRKDVQRWAGVAAMIRETESGPAVMMIRRSEHPKDPWSGHMAMPGGRMDPTDATVRAAAEREALEEVGVDLAADGRLLGRLDDVGAVAKGVTLGMVIAPFVYAIERPVDVTPNHEVQEALWVPLNDLTGPNHRTTRPYPVTGGRLLLPAWSWNDRMIWGLTYNMLSGLLRITMDR